MCGIAGFFGVDSISDYQISTTLSLMKRRGPDDSGCYRYRSDKVNIVLLHSRLSITGSAQSGVQPLVNNNFALVFNGEIYNYRDLYHKHSSSSLSAPLSDTEVLFWLINQHLSSESFYNELDGMWSFVYFDIQHQKLVLSRDIFGEKPLFFLKTRTGVFFGSSPIYIQSLANISLAPDYNKLDLFLQFDFRLFTSPNESFASGIQSVPPGTELTISSTFEVSQNKFFSPYSIPKMDLPHDPHELNTLIFDTLKKSFSSRLDTDQISTLFLSGGVDSSSIAMLSHSNFPYLRYLSIANGDPRYNEVSQINDVIRSFDCNQHQFLTPSFSSSSILDRLIDFSLQSFSPLPFQNYLLFDAMCMASKSNGSKVVYSGLGGDELFAGYLSHWQFYFQDLRSNAALWQNEYLNFQTKSLPHIRNQQFTSFTFDSSFINPFSYFEDSYPDLLSSSFSQSPFYPGPQSRSSLIDKLNIDTFYSTLPPHLFAADMVSMYHGLECRCPFLSKDLLCLSRNIPNTLFMQSGFNKSLLRTSLSSYLPHSVCFQSDKKGFNFEFSSKYLSDFSIFNDLLLDCSYLSDRLDLDFLLRQHKHSSLTNSQSKLFFRAVSIAAFLVSQ